MKNRVLKTCLTALALSVAGFANANPVSLGSASEFTVLSATGAVNCTNSTIEGDVGSAVAGTKTGCVQSGEYVTPVSQDIQADFSTAYSALAGEQCDNTLTTLAGQVLQPGTYCVDNASTNTGGILTLDGDASDTWLFKIGASGAGALTGTDFVVNMSGGAEACNVTWWVADAVTLTRGDFKGDILAGKAVTVTGVASNSPLKGRVMANGTVVMTNADALGCVAEAAARTEEAIAAALAAKLAAEAAEAAALLAVVTNVVGDVIGPNGENVIGAQGEPGIAGARGDAGVNGANGANGDTGAPGIQGLPGNAGTNGVNGAVGAKGDAGATGAQGIQGLSGDAGASGATGLMGLNGATGATGAQGASGDDGATGAQGIQGLSGDAGATGSAGVQGIQGDAGAVGAAGTVGDTGATGPAGPAGLGAVVFNSAPTVDDDVNRSYTVGTVWIDTSAAKPYILVDSSAGAAVWTVLGGSTTGSLYTIGDAGPSGGIVFYITDGGLHGLEAAPVDQVSAEWGCYGTPISGANGTAVGTGEQNTADIVEFCDETTAASVASAYGPGWYLPSKDELNLLYVQKDDGVVGGFAGNAYWSSSQANASKAWSQNIVNGYIDGYQYEYYKFNTLRVRAVRAF